MTESFGPEFASLDEALIGAVTLLLRNGETVAPRDLPTREIVPFAFSISQPRRRYVSVPCRRWSIAYAIAEFAWHVRASDSMEEIAFYAPRWRTIARGPTVVGSSYGARIFRRSNQEPSQWDRAMRVLRQDAASRRAVLTFGVPDGAVEDPRADVACALTLQLLVRGGKLHAVCTMRSNDVVLGMPYDVFLFTMLQEMAATELGYELGSYFHQAASLHVYESQIQLAERVLASRPNVFDAMSPMSELGSMSVLLDREVASRLGTKIQGEEHARRSYWSDLADVLESWARVRTGDPAKDPPTIRDAVLRALFAQWVLGAKKP